MPSLKALEALFGPDVGFTSFSYARYIHISIVLLTDSLLNGLSPLPLFYRPWSYPLLNSIQWWKLSWHLHIMSFFLPVNSLLSVSFKRNSYHIVAHAWKGGKVSENKKSYEDKCCTWIFLMIERDYDVSDTWNKHIRVKNYASFL